jgi:AcrR family transcriptional regulator
MPRISAAREQAVRTRIAEAALRVFGAKGYHDATIADVVRESGLSVGSIYSHFRGKDDLFFAACDLSAGAGLGELAARTARGRTTVERLAISIGFYLDMIEPGFGGPDLASMLIAQWGRAEADPVVRMSLVRRREQFTTAGELLVRDGIRLGELPAWFDAAALAQAWLMFLDGMLLWRLELGDGYRREEAERRALALLAPIVAAAAVPVPPQLPRTDPQPWLLDAFTVPPRRP